MKVELNPKLLDLVELEGGSGPFRVTGTIVEILREQPRSLLIEIADESGVPKQFVTRTLEEVRRVWTSPETAASEATPNEALRVFEEGVLLLQNGYVEQARRHFSEAFERDPRFAGSLMNLANDLAQKDAFDAAIFVYSMILDLQPRYELARENLAIAYLNRGVDHARRGALDKALDDFNCGLLTGPSQKVVELTRKNLVAAYTQLGIRHAESNQHRETLDKLVIAFELSPSDITRRNLALAFVSFFASQTETDLLWPDEASFKPFLRMGLTLSECLNAYGATLAMLGRISEARRILQEAASADPTNESARSNLDLVSAQQLPSQPVASMLGLKPLEAERVPHTSVQ